MSTVRQGACHFRDYIERDTVLPTVTGLRKESDPMSSSTASAPPSPPQTAEPRLSLQCEPIAADTTVIRSLDWDRSRFDIEFGLRNGTTLQRLPGTGRTHGPGGHQPRQVP